MEDYYDGAVHESWPGWPRLAPSCQNLEAKWDQQRSEVVVRTWVEDHKGRLGLL